MSIATTPVLCHDTVADATSAIEQAGYMAAAGATVAMSQARRAIKREHERAMSGEVSVEYVVIVALVIIGLIGGFTLLARALDGKLKKITDVITSADSIRPTA